MEFETLRWIAIISVLANIFMIYLVSKLFFEAKYLALGGLYGIEKTAGHKEPDLSADMLKKYINFCHTNYSKYVVPNISKGGLK